VSHIASDEIAEQPGLCFSDLNSSLQIEAMSDATAGRRREIAMETRRPVENAIGDPATMSVPQFFDDSVEVFALDRPRGGWDTPERRGYRFEKPQAFLDRLAPMALLQQLTGPLQRGLDHLHRSLGQRWNCRVH